MDALRIKHLLVLCIRSTKEEEEFDIHLSLSYGGVLSKYNVCFDRIVHCQSPRTDDTEIALLSTGDSTIVHDGVCECSGDSVLKAQDLSRWRKYT